MGIGCSCINSLFSGLPPQGRPQEVFGAFAAFREKRCLQQRQPKGAAGGAAGPKGGAASKLLGSSGSGGSSGVPGQRLLLTAEVLHILRPVAYALALRRWVPLLLLLAVAAARCCCCCRPSCGCSLVLVLLSSCSSVPSICRFLRAACRWGRSSWRPWLLSLSIDLLSMQLGSAGARAAGSSTWFGGVQPANLGPSLVLLRCLQQTRCGGPPGALPGFYRMLLGPVPYACITCMGRCCLLPGTPTNCPTVLPPANPYCYCHCYSALLQVGGRGGA